MLVFRIPLLPRGALAKIEENLRRQAETGVVVLPPGIELLNEVPADEEIQIIQQDARVAELEAALEAERAKNKHFGLSEKVCRHCKNSGAPASQSSCWGCSKGDLFTPRK